MSLSTIKERFRNSYFHPRYLAQREILKIIKEEGPTLTGKLLDVGCGKKPYAGYLPGVDRHIGLDIPVSMHGNSEVDVFGTGLNLPFAAQSFDSILCTEVLEHTQQPVLAIKEMNRVTKLGGLLLLTVPFSEQLHEEPYDFFRFTIHGVRQLLISNGWVILRLHKRGGTFLELGYRTSSFLYSTIGATRTETGGLNPRPVLGPLVIAICTLVQLFSDLLDHLWQVDLSTIGYGIVAQKVAEADK
jgi:SAM-dependent methyltransferase